jgi:hypothetical protein
MAATVAPAKDIDAVVADIGKGRRVCHPIRRARFDCNEKPRPKRG